MRTYQLMPVMPVKEWKRPEPTAEGISIRVASWSRALPDLYRYLDYCADQDIPTCSILWQANSQTAR